MSAIKRQCRQLQWECCKPPQVRQFFLSLAPLSIPYSLHCKLSSVPNGHAHFVNVFDFNKKDEGRTPSRPGSVVRGPAPDPTSLLQVQTQRQSEYFSTTSGMTSQFADIGTYRSVLNTGTSRRSSTAGRQSILDSVNFEKAIDSGITCSIDKNSGKYNTSRCLVALVGLKWWSESAS